MNALSTQHSALSTVMYAKIAIDLPFSPNTDDCFYYLIPEELKEDIKVGGVVHVPFGKQDLSGFVLDISACESEFLIKKDVQFKPVYEIIHKQPIWDTKFLNLASWINKYYLTSIGTVLAASISSEIFDRYIQEAELVDSVYETVKLTDNQRFIVDKFYKSKKKSLSYRFLYQRSKLSKHNFYVVINQLKNRGVIKTRIRSLKPRISVLKEQGARIKDQGIWLKIQDSKLILNSEQEAAYETILKSIKKNEFKAYLLHGVTGSGKTEVYLRLIEEVIRSNKAVIYLVPEIYLMPQVYERLKNRFKEEEIIVWHSLLARKERLSNFEKILAAKSKIILGARSAILAPICNIGLVVIDEAHDSSYKQASPAPRYDAVMVAKKRGEIENCVVILGTATPNITDYYLSSKNGTLLTLSKRIENYQMPKVHLVDLKTEYLQANKNIISNLLKNSISEALDKKEQVILLLNRRGYSSHIFCRACGYIQFCKNCSVPLVFHKNNNLMICHHCGYRHSALSTQGSPAPTALCPNCKSPHFRYFGLGTEQLEEEVKKLFSTAKVIRVDRDQLRQKDSYIDLWLKFANGAADILIGTQLVAKGLDLPSVTVVGVILADTMLNFPDYVSYERAFQLLTQVTGRSGRGIKGGKVFIQTYKVDNLLFKFIQEHDYSGFYKREIEQREQFLYPPYTKLSRIIFQSYDEQDCTSYANGTLRILTEVLTLQSVIPNLQFLGPAPCFFTKLHGKYRYHILCKVSDEKNQEFLFNNLFQRQSKNAKVEMIIDVDSVNLL